MKDKWNMHESHNMLVQEETWLNYLGNHFIQYVKNQELERKL